MPDDVNIAGVGGLGRIGPGLVGPTRRAQQTAKTFKDTFFEQIQRVNSLQKEAESAMSKFAAGETENVSEVFVAVQKADLAFKTLMQIRNKLFEAYREISQLRV